MEPQFDHWKTIFRILTQWLSGSMLAFHIAYLFGTFGIPVHVHQERPLGRHWLLPYGRLLNLSAELIADASACVAQACEECSLRINGWSGVDLVAPCAWVNAKGQLNVLCMEKGEEGMARAFGHFLGRGQGPGEEILIYRQGVRR